MKASSTLWPLLLVTGLHSAVALSPHRVPRSRPCSPSLSSSLSSSARLSVKRFSPASPLSQASDESSTAVPVKPRLKKRLASFFSNSNGKVSSSIEAPASGILPSYKSLCIFTATTILIWLSEPLLSLVDTTIVGLTTASSQAILQIAALGPATTLYDSAIYMTYFLAISTTNQLAPKLAAKDWRGLRRSTSHLMGLAILFGVVVSAVTFGIGRQLIAQMVGPDMSPEIIPLATNYARIRALVSPFCVVGFVAQSVS